MDNVRLKNFLDRKVKEYNRPSFIDGDPISIPHQFSKKQDIEISGFFAATFAWGIRTTIISKTKTLMRLMDDAPHDFIVNHIEKDRRRFETFCHRTFNSTDLLYFISFLQSHYQTHESLESAFTDPEITDGTAYTPGSAVERALDYFYKYFFSLEDIPARTRKHIAAPMKNSACKRLNMYLRWMVRNDNKGVDFGLWKSISQSELICPLDLHVARVAKHFDLLDRPNPDWSSALQLTNNLKKFDKKDPAKYDFALFALGVIERF